MVLDQRGLFYTCVGNGLSLIFVAQSVVLNPTAGHSIHYSLPTRINSLTANQKSYTINNN